MKKLTNLQYLFIGLGVGVFLCSFGFWQWQKSKDGFDIIAKNNQVESSKSGEVGIGKEIVIVDEEEEIVVHIAGAVIKPGLIKIKSTLRLGEALMQAGGIREDADLDRLNLAMFLQDGCRYYVPSFSEKTDSDSSKNNFDDGKVDINKADLSRLMTLSQIGETRAKAILNYREKQGDFQRIEDLMNVPGIGEGIFSAIKDEIKVR